MKFKSLLSTFLLLFGLFAQAQTPVLLSADRADSLLKATPNLQVLDVRTAEEFAGGHLQQARNLDVRDSAFVRNLRRLDPSRPVLVYCLVGGRSAKAAALLAQNGFTVYDMQGGFTKWNAAGKPIEGGSPAIKGAMTMTELKAATASRKPVLIDFYAKWCGPCQQMLPMINRLKTELKDQVSILTIDYDQNRELARQLGVDEIPTFLLYKNGDVKWRGLGTIQEDMFRAKIKEVQ